MLLDLWGLHMWVQMHTPSLWDYSPWQDLLKPSLVPCPRAPGPSCPLGRCHYRIQRPIIRH